MKKTRINPGGAYSKVVVVMHDPRFPSGERAIMKEAAGLRREYSKLAESMTDTIDELLGWNIVPPTSARRLPATQRMPSQDVTIQEWLPHSKTLHVIAGGWRARDGDIYHEKVNFELASNDLRAMQIGALDFIIGNTDRHTGNLLIDRNGVLWAIDHSLAFPTQKNPEPVTMDLFEYLDGRKIPDSILQDLRDLKEGDLRAAVGARNKYLLPIH